MSDIPKKTILVLLVLTIAISVLGTWTVLSATSQGPRVNKVADTAQGEVSITINPPPGTANVVKSESSGSGVVTLEIK